MRSMLPSIRWSPVPGVTGYLPSLGAAPNHKGNYAGPGASSEALPDRVTAALATGALPELSIQGSRDPLFARILSRFRAS